MVTTFSSRSGSTVLGIVCVGKRVTKHIILGDCGGPRLEYDLDEQDDEVVRCDLIMQAASTKSWLNKYTTTSLDMFEITN
jgi:hypothetical protein